jgi:hypothetical protein
MKKLFEFALLATLALPLAAQAQTSGSGSWSRFSYTYAELRYVVQDPDGPSDDFDGLRLGGSLLLQPQLFAVGSIGSVSNGPVDIDTIDLGVGYRTALQNNVDFVAIGGLIFADVNTPGGGDDDSGISLTGGVRAMLAPQFEVGGYISYVDLYGDGDIGLTGEALFHVNPNVTLLASLGFSDDANTITLGGRWNFTPTR